MQRPDCEQVLIKIGIIDGRTFSPAQIDVWSEILGEPSLADALAAVVAFYSKPFKRPAYPGDIKAHILEIEDVRLRRCGSLQANEADWIEGPPGPVHARLRRLVSRGEWTAEDYRGYSRSGLTLDKYLEKQGAHVG